MVSVSRVTVVNRTLAAVQTRSRSWRCIDRICRATFRCSEARKRHSVDCGGSRVTFKMPVRMGSRAMKRSWWSRAKPT